METIITNVLEVSLFVVGLFVLRSDNRNVQSYTKTKKTKKRKKKTHQKSKWKWEEVTRRRQKNKSEKVMKKQNVFFFICTRTYDNSQSVYSSQGFTAFDVRMNS